MSYQSVIINNFRNTNRAGMNTKYKNPNLLLKIKVINNKMYPSII